MSRKTASQWEFGDLFDPPDKTEAPVQREAPPVEPKAQSKEERSVLTVTQLTASVRRLLEDGFRQIWVTGEVTNLRRQGSGHIYFSLKDSRAQVSCVLFRGERVANRDLLEDGRKVLLSGDVTVYEARGQYQLRVQAIELQGVGALQAAFEQLKAKLNAEGLFAQERKRPLVPYPQRIGLVTSPTGAAIRDVIHVIQRRQPGLEVILAPSRVQGEGAAGEIAGAIRLLNGWASLGAADCKLDLILVTRGGGSLEDLWAFNEEVVARAIYESAVPVVSAIGHEIDFTISDFVADLRAATPSAAAEIITEGVFASRQFVADCRAFLRKLVWRRLEECRNALGEWRGRLGRVHPRRFLDDRLQRLDELQSALLRSSRRALRDQQLAVQHLVQRLSRVKPRVWIEAQRREAGELERRLWQAARHQVREQRNRLERVSSQLTLLGPVNTLERGYSITTDAVSGKIIRGAEELAPGGRVRTRLGAGEVVSVVESVSEASLGSDS